MSENSGDDNNVVPFPSTPARRFRIAKNKLTDHFFGKDEPMTAPGPAHAAHRGMERKKSDTSAANLDAIDDMYWGQTPPISTRNEEFDQGHSEAKIHDISEGKLIRYKRRDTNLYDQNTDPEKN